MPFILLLFLLQSRTAWQRHLVLKKYLATLDGEALIIAEMLDGYRIAPDDFAPEPYSSNFYIGVSRLALGKEADAVRVEEALDSGSEEPSIAINHYVLSTQGRSRWQLISTEC